MHEKYFQNQVQYLQDDHVRSEILLFLNAQSDQTPTRIELILPNHLAMSLVSKMMASVNQQINQIIQPLHR